MQSPANQATQQMPSLAFTITETHMILGSESTVESAIRTLSSSHSASLASVKWFTAARSNIPSTVGLASLEDTATSFELIWWLMKELTKTGGSAGPANPIGDLMFSKAGFDMFNFALLPKFEAVRKYFGLFASYGISRDDGFFFEFKSINPTSTN